MALSGDEVAGHWLTLPLTRHPPAFIRSIVCRTHEQRTTPDGDPMPRADGSIARKGDATMGLVVVTAYDFFAYR